MGIVYKAFDIQLERYAALKILNISSNRSSSFVERFKREARNQAKLSHPNIVSVYGFVQEKDVLGIAMEYIEGDTLESLIKNNGRIEFSYALELMEQILNGIESAHNQGFIHRDLKPSNIILDLNGNAKIMDFGISKSIDELKTITQHNARPGTLLYMSPEQLSGNSITIKSDLYSLAVTFYEMLSGVHPYKADTIYEIIDSHVKSLPPKLSEQIETIPSEVDELILKAMGKFSSNNFESTNEFRNALNSLPKNYFKKNTNSSNIEITNEYKEPNLKKSSKGFQRVSNILLLVTFIGLGVIVYNVVKSLMIEEAEKSESNSLNYTQDYSKNPNYFSRSNWEIMKWKTDANLNSIFFVNDYEGFIAGDSGVILNTIDGGITWKKVSDSYTNNFNSFAFSDEKIFFVGSDGFIGYLGRSGKKIIKVNSNSTDTFFKIYFLNSNIGFIVGSRGTILKTYDSGQTWKIIQSKVSENLFSVSFSDKKNGFIVGWEGTVLKTENEGETWNKTDLGYKSYFKDVLFVNQFLGFMVGGEGKILRTKNGGNDWDEIEIDSDAGLYKIRFYSNENGLILSNKGDVFISEDAGNSWDKINVGKPVALNDIKKLITGNFIVAANNGNIFKSKVISK